MTLTANSRGALFMILAMAAFACNDALVKALTVNLTAAQIMAVRGAMTTALVFAVARAAGVRITLGVLANPLILLRAFCEIGGTLAFTSALARVDFATAYSILQSLPLAVTLAAAVFLREPVGWRRWTAISVGFLGVVIILQPGPEGFTPAALFAVGAVLFAASRDVTTKRIDRNIPTIVVTLFTAFATSLTGFALIVPMGGWHPIDGSAYLLLTIAAVLTFAGYQCVIMGMRSGDISFVAPFRYTGLVWALIIGILVFGEHPASHMLVGAAVVIGSGLYTLYREHKLRASVAAKATAVPYSGPVEP